MTESFFITGSGTDIGKTFITSLMAANFRISGESVDVFKPVVTGFNPETPKTCDTYSLLSAAKGRTPSIKEIADACPWRFLPSISPHLAAERVGRTISVNEVARCCHKESLVAKAKGSRLLIEGIGGVMVPLNYQETTLDLMENLNIPTILVVGSYLGSLSHSLSALSVLKNRNIKLSAIIVNESVNSTVSLEQTVSTIRQFATKDIDVLSVPRLILDEWEGRLHDSLWHSLMQQTPELQKWLNNQTTSPNIEHHFKQLEEAS